MRPPGVDVADDSQRDVVQLVGDRARSARSVYRVLVVTEEKQTVDLEGQRPAQPTPVAETLRDGLGRAKMLERSLVLAEESQRVAQTDTQVHRPGVGVPCLGQPLNGLQRLLVPRDRFVVGRLRERLRPCLLEIVGRPFPKVAISRVMGEPFSVFAQPVWIELLDGVDDAAVKRSPSLPQQ